MTQSARKPTAQVMSYIGREIDWTDARQGDPWPFGCLPAFSTPNALSVLISQGFAYDVGLDYIVRIGTAADPIRWFEQGFSGSGAARIDITINADKARPMARDFESYVSVTPVTPGAKPIAGHAVVWMSYLPQPLLRDQTAKWV